MSERVYEFSFSRMDLPRLERCFEERAGKGKMITRLSGGLGNGVFEDVFERKYHFCVRPYDRLLDDGALRSEEFAQFKKEFEERGWTFQCGLMNLAVFYSKDDERPPEPDIPWEKQRERLLSVTERAELRFVASEMLLYIVCVGMIIYTFLTSRNRLYIEIGRAVPAFWVIFLAASLVIFATTIAFHVLPHCQMRRTLRLGERSPEILPFWDRLTCLCVNMVALTVLQAISAWYEGWRGTMTICALLIVLVCAVLVLRINTYKKAKPLKWEVYSRQLGVALVVLLAIAITVSF